MILTERQKSIISKIADGMVYDSSTFMEFFCTEYLKKVIIQDEGNKRSYNYNKEIVSEKSTIVFGITKDNKFKVVELLKEFLLVIHLLRDENLILVFKENNFNKVKKYIGDGDKVVDGQFVSNNYLNSRSEVVSNLFREIPNDDFPTLKDIELHPTIYMKEFIEKGFITKKELNLLDTNRRSKRSLWIATGTALISLIVSIVFNVLTLNKSVPQPQDYTKLIQDENLKVINSINSIDIINIKEYQKLIEKVQGLEAELDNAESLYIDLSDKYNSLENKFIVNQNTDKGEGK